MIQTLNNLRLLLVTFLLDAAVATLPETHPKKEAFGFAIAAAANALT